MNGQAVEEWLKKAEDNYLSAIALSRRRKNPVPRCYLQPMPTMC